MELLSPYNAKATFFCVGENVRCFPEVVRALLDAGHALGNHTEQHVNGWKTSTFDYARNYLKCAEVINSRLFRPPYGRITKAQTDCLKSRCEIVMWDVLSADFDAKVNEEQCYQNVVRNVVEGSIVLLTFLAQPSHYREKPQSILPPHFLQHSDSIVLRSPSHQNQH